MSGPLTTRSTRTPTGGAARLGGRRLPWFVRAQKAMATAAFTRRKMVAAVMLGASWPWVGAVIVILGGYLVLPLIAWFATFGYSLEVSQVVTRIGAATIWAVAYGFILGIPLGLLTVGRVWAYGLVFIVSAMVAHLLLSLFESGWASGDVSIFLATWSLPETWLGLAAVVGFGTVAANLRAHGVRQRSAAP